MLQDLESARDVERLTLNTRKIDHVRRQQGDAARPGLLDRSQAEFEPDIIGMRNMGTETARAGSDFADASTRRHVRGGQCELLTLAGIISGMTRQLVVEGAVAEYRRIEERETGCWLVEQTEGRDAREQPAHIHAETKPVAQNDLRHVELV